MKFVCSVDINLSREKVVELWADPDNMIHWQDSFLSMEALSGEQGKAGSKSRMVYAHKNSEMELVETILVNNLPDEFTGRYEHTHMVNTMKNTFSNQATDKTRWEAEVEYIQFNSFIPKMMAKFFPGMFKKQTQKWLNQFKAFAEDIVTSK